MSAPARIPLFRQHPRSWRENHYVYPVVSRRSAGLSIGINLNPDGACNFDCVYCCVDRTSPRAAPPVRLDVVRDELHALLAEVSSGSFLDQPPFDQTPRHLRRLNDIAFSGDGEPTSSPVFPDACELVAELLQSLQLHSTKIVLITNATLLHRPKAVQALCFLDHHNGEVWAKLDAGTEDFYRQVDRTRVPLIRVLHNLLATGREREIVVQSMFLRLHDQPPPPGEIDAYLRRLKDLTDQGCRIKLVQVYTVARSTAERWITPLADDQLDAIVARVRSIPLPALAFYAPA